MIEIGDILDSKRERYGTQDSDSFLRSFRIAILRTLGDLKSSKVGLTLTYDEAFIENESLNIDSWYLGVINDGVDHYLALEGRWGMATKVDLAAQYIRSLNEAHTRRASEVTVTTRLGAV